MILNPFLPPIMSMGMEQEKFSTPKPESKDGVVAKGKEKFNPTSYVTKFLNPVSKKFKLWQHMTALQEDMISGINALKDNSEKSIKPLQDMIDQFNSGSLNISNNQAEMISDLKESYQKMSDLMDNNKRGLITSEEYVDQLKDLVAESSDQTKDIQAEMKRDENFQRLALKAMGNDKTTFERAFDNTAKSTQDVISKYDMTTGMYNKSVEKNNDYMRGITEKVTETGFDLFKSSGGLGQVVGMGADILKQLGVSDAIKDKIAGDKEKKKTSAYTNEKKGLFSGLAKKRDEEFTLKGYDRESKSKGMSKFYKKGGTKLPKEVSDWFDASGLTGKKVKVDKTLMKEFWEGMNDNEQPEPPKERLNRSIYGINDTDVKQEKTFKKQELKVKKKGLSLDYKLKVLQYRHFRDFPKKWDNLMSKLDSMKKAEGEKKSGGGGGLAGLEGLMKMGVGLAGASLLTNLVPEVKKGIDSTVEKAKNWMGEFGQSFSSERTRMGVGGATNGVLKTFGGFTSKVSQFQELDTARRMVNDPNFAKNQMPQTYQHYRDQASSDKTLTPEQINSKADKLFNENIITKFAEALDAKKTQTDENYAKMVTKILASNDKNMKDMLKQMGMIKTDTSGNESMTPYEEMLKRGK